MNLNDQENNEQLLRKEPENKIPEISKKDFIEFLIQSISNKSYLS